MSDGGKSSSWTTLDVLAHNQYRTPCSFLLLYRVGSKIANTKKGGGGADAETALDVDEEEGGGALEAAGISAKEIKNVFTELRKGANHPLMLLNYFKGGGKLEEVIKVLHRTGYFGAQATKDMVSLT